MNAGCSGFSPKESFPSFRLGCENTRELEKALKGKSPALVMNRSSLGSDGKTSLKIISQFAKVKKLFSLEHGIRGTFKAGEDTKDQKDFEGLPVVSLYDKGSRSLAPEEIKGLDLIVWDIQDLGLRFYTYLGSLKSLVKDCKNLKINLLVLDRPCPFGRKVFGNILKEDSFSFVGPDSLPVSYGLTPGEAALMFCKEEKCENLLTIVRLEGWKGEPYWEKPWKWVPPSPAILDFETAFLYSGLCLLEGTNISEGRGTSSPFKILGAPFVDANLLKKKMQSLCPWPGIEFEKASFVPKEGKFQGKLCHGLVLHATDYEKAEPLRFALFLISALFKLFKETEELPGTGNLTKADRLAGKGELEKIIKDPEGTWERWQKESQNFKAEHIYE